MIVVGIDPVILRVGHLALRWYGLIVAAAVALGVWLAGREASRKGLGVALDAMVPWIVLGGFVGARLFHVVDHWTDVFQAQPLRALFIWEGGLAIWGAVFGGLLTAGFLSWRRGVPFLRLADAVTPGLLLGQSIGRLACIITGDAVGRPTAGPLGLAYTQPGAMVPQLGVFYTPTPLYEVVANLAILALIWRLRRRGWADGLLFLTYLGLYSIARFAVGYSSAYRVVAYGLTQSQLVAAAAMLAVVPVAAMLLLRQRAALRA